MRWLSSKVRPAITEVSAREVPSKQRVAGFESCPARP
jgi:hypothetical protein